MNKPTAARCNNCGHRIASHSENYPCNVVDCDCKQYEPIPPEPTTEGVPSNRDWTEDFSHENGQYHCFCATCNLYFIGHKRRITCKQCAIPPEPSQSEDAARDAAIQLAYKMPWGAGEKPFLAVWNAAMKYAKESQDGK